MMTIEEVRSYRADLYDEIAECKRIILENDAKLVAISRIFGSDI